MYNFMINRFSKLLFLLLSVLCTIYGLEENDFCTNDNGMRGICRRSENCKTLQKTLRAGVRPKICGFTRDGIYPVICCAIEEKGGRSLEPDQRFDLPNADRALAPPYLIAKQKCAEYGLTVKEIVQDPALAGSTSLVEINHCGREADALILGGVEALPKEFPHMALIGYKDTPDWACGGSLISEEYVLSAAHCSRPKRKGAAKWVKLGELHKGQDDMNDDPIIFRIDKIINHPQYNEKTLYNDIALFKLNEEVEFSPYIRPICLPSKPDVPDILSASGWGHTEWGGKPSAKLMKVNLDVVSNAICNSNYSQTISRGVQIPQGILDTMVCAGSVAGKDACQGDSGGPLQANISDPYCMYNIIGVTSFGRGCGLGYPGVYTRVYKYVPWIVETIWTQES